VEVSSIQNFYTSTRNIELARNFEGNGLERKLVLITVIAILLMCVLSVAFRVGLQWIHLPHTPHFSCESSVSAAE